MIKQYLLTIEASDENLIKTYVEQFNVICKAIEKKSPIKLWIEEEKTNG